MIWFLSILITLAWDYDFSKEPSFSNFVLRDGATVIWMGTNKTVEVDTQPGVEHDFSVTAKNQSNLESDPATLKVYVAITAFQCSTNLTNWIALRTNTLILTNAEVQMFYRSVMQIKP